MSEHDARVTPFALAGAPAPRETRFASLSASLLARKGEAEPAMEPFAHARVAESARQMGPGERHEMSRVVLRPQGGGAAPSADAPSPDCPRRRLATGGKRAAVTFRVSIHEFLRLQLAAAELERTTQDIIIDALRDYLDAHGVENLAECRCAPQADTTPSLPAAG